MPLSVRIVTTALGVVFLASGLTRLLGLPMQAELFAQFGFPRWMIYAVGAVEVLIAVLTLTPSTHSYGAVGVVLLMAGAVLTHAVTGVRVPMIALNALLLFPAIWVVRRDRPRFLRVV
jgi:uncharacterized membrane protein YphA (DoxX/SURF4 family)